MPKHQDQPSAGCNHPSSAFNIKVFTQSRARRDIIQSPSAGSTHSPAADEQKGFPSIDPSVQRFGWTRWPSGSHTSPVVSALARLLLSTSREPAGKPDLTEHICWTHHHSLTATALESLHNLPSAQQPQADAPSIGWNTGCSPRLNTSLIKVGDAYFSTFWSSRGKWTYLSLLAN